MRFKKVKVNQTKLCWNEQDLYFHQKTIREYSVKHDSFFHTCLTFWKKPNMLVYLHLGAIFHTCLDFDTYVWEKAHMCEKATQLHDCKCLAFCTHVWDKPPTCFSPLSYRCPASHWACACRCLLHKCSYWAAWLLLPWAAAAPTPSPSSLPRKEKACPFAAQIEKVRRRYAVVSTV